MNPQYLEYIREQLFAAMVESEGRSKGQLAAFEGAALADTSTFRRVRHRDLLVGKRLVCRETEPLLCSGTRSRKHPFPPIDEVTYRNSSWRRAVLALADHQQAWVRYCYAGDIEFSLQSTLCLFVWDGFTAAQGGKRMSVKVKGRLRELVWLAVQQTASMRVIYTAGKLAELTGVETDNWAHNYDAHWHHMLKLCRALDEGVLHDVVNIRNAKKSHVSDTMLA